MSLLWVSIIGVIALYALILVGNGMPIVLPESVLGLGPRSQWILLLFAYAASPRCCRCGCCCSRATTSTACSCSSASACSTAPC
jgi:hypothetical protein